MRDIWPHQNQVTFRERSNIIAHNTLAKTFQNQYQFAQFMKMKGIAQKVLIDYFDMDGPFAGRAEFNKLSFG